MGFGIIISGLTLAFTKAWAYTLCLLAILPFMVAIMVISERMMRKGTVAAKKAYSQSGGYSEQALNAVKIVVAFGMEQTELDNFVHYLEPARKAALMSAFGASTATSSIIFIMFIMYAYAFFVG